MEQVNNMLTHLCLCLSAKRYVLDHDLVLSVHVCVLLASWQFKLLLFKVGSLQYTYLHNGTNNSIMEEITSWKLTHVFINCISHVFVTLSLYQPSLN